MPSPVLPQQQYTPRAGNLDPVGDGKTTPGTRAARRLWSVVDYGAKGDGVTNDAAAILVAAAACPAFGTLYFPFPPVGYLVKGSGTECLLINKNISLLGDHAIGSLILVDPSVGSSTDVIRIAVPGHAYFQRIEHLNIQPVSGTPARHALNIDVTASGAYQSDMLIEGNFFGATGGNSICLTNPSNTDGWFTSKIRRNLMMSGMSLLRLGDSMIIEGNSFGRLGPDYFGTNKTAITMSAVSGASRCIIRNNNCVIQGGFLRVLSADQLIVEGNQVEQALSPAGMPESACLALVGSAAQVTNTRIVGNNFNGHSTALHTLYVDNAAATYIDGNTVIGGATDNVLLTANASGTIIGPHAVPALSTFTDLGSGTVWPHPTATNGRLTLGSTLVVPTGYTATGLTLSPLAGNYLILVNARVYQGSGSGAVFLKLRNTTDSTDAGAEKTAIDFAGYTDQNVSLSWIVTLPYGKTIELYARSAAGTESLLVNGNGGTEVNYVRLT